MRALLPISKPIRWVERVGRIRFTPHSAINPLGSRRKFAFKERLKPRQQRAHWEAFSCDKGKHAFVVHRKRQESAGLYADFVVSGGGDKLPRVELCRRVVCEDAGMRRAYSMLPACRVAVFLRYRSFFSICLGV